MVGNSQLVILQSTNQSIHTDSTKKMVDIGQVFARKSLMDYPNLFLV